MAEFEPVLLKDQIAPLTVRPGDRYNVQTGRFVFGLTLSETGDGVWFAEGASPQLDELNLGYGEPYSTVTRFNSPILLFPGESVQIGRTEGVEVFDASGAPDIRRRNMFADGPFTRALDADRGLSRAHAIITVLGEQAVGEGLAVQVMDAGSFNGTLVSMPGEQNRVAS